MSRAACRIIIDSFEINKVGPGHLLESCLRQACGNPEIANAIAADETATVNKVRKYLQLPQMSRDQQRHLRCILNEL